MTLLTLGSGMLFDQLELCVPVVDKGNQVPLESIRGMALGAIPLKLVPMWILVAVRTLRLEIVELRGPQMLSRRLGNMAFLTGHSLMLCHQRELGVLVVNE